MTRLPVLAAIILLPTLTSADPSTCPGVASVTGYSDLQMLQDDIDAITPGSSDPATFTICPGSVFRLNTTGGNQGLTFNVLDRSNTPAIRIECGQDPMDNPFGANDCVIQGGMHHVWIQSVGELTIQGVTFENATRGSVWTGTGMDEITFEDCVWRDNSYSWSQALGEVSCPTGCAGAIGGKDGATVFKNCEFLSNEGDSGAVFGENMTYTFEGCTFERNAASARNMGTGAPPTGSAITLVDAESTLSLRNNCFLYNVGFGPATVMVEDESVLGRSGSFTSLRVNSNNFFDGNRVAMANLDSRFQWCHNSIYNYIPGSDDFQIDDCVLGTAECCQCPDPSQPTEVPEPQSQTETGAGSSAGRVVLGAATLTALVSSIMV